VFTQSFKITALGVAQIVTLGAVGYFLVKGKILKEEGVTALSRVVVYVTLPALIFCQLIKNFSFHVYKDWWFFPLLSIGITAVGFIVGKICAAFVAPGKTRVQFISLVMFQNSGYLPLALISALLPAEKADTMLIYLFLLLLGFNLLVWSLGSYMLSAAGARKFSWSAVISPPVVATLLGLGVVLLGGQRFFPEVVYKPLKMLGDCTITLALFVVGGNLAQISLKAVDKKAITLLVFAKLIALPLLGLFFLLHLRVPELLGLLILMELAVPSATSLSVIVRHHDREDLFISQGIFFTHLVSLVTLPLFLSLYFSHIMLQ